MAIISCFPSGSGGGGGIALAAVSSITTLASSGKVYVKWIDPDDIIVSGATLAEWGGTLLVRKAGSYPACAGCRLLVCGAHRTAQPQRYC